MELVQSLWPARIARARGWLALLFLAPVAIVAAFSKPYLVEESLAEFVVDFAGWSLFATGACLRWWATLYISGRKNDELVTMGPYSVCRNPLYLSNLFMTLSVGVFLQSVTLTLAICIASVCYLLVTVRVEERNLFARHGDAFARYCQSVPRFVPNFAGYQSPAEVTVRLSGVWAETLRMGRWIWIPLLCHLVEHLRMETWWPLTANLP